MMEIHKLCDNMGPTLVIVETIDGKILGGYTKEDWSVANVFKNKNSNWDSISGYKIDEHAFIFSLEKRQKAKIILSIVIQLLAQLLVEVMIYIYAQDV